MGTGEGDPLPRHGRVRRRPSNRGFCSERSRRSCLKTDDNPEGVDKVRFFDDIKANRASADRLQVVRRLSSANFLQTPMELAPEADRKTPRYVRASQVAAGALVVRELRHASTRGSPTSGRDVEKIDIPTLVVARPPRDRILPFENTAARLRSAVNPNIRGSCRSRNGPPSNIGWTLPGGRAHRALAGFPWRLKVFAGRLSTTRSFHCRFPSCLTLNAAMEEFQVALGIAWRAPIDAHRFRFLGGRTV